MAAIRRALISVYDKSGVRELAEALSARDVEILSTGGTARLLEEIGVRVTSVSDYTGQEEILGGRVKTLHPRIFGGILHRRLAEPEAPGSDVPVIDLVAVNLYPFRETVAAPDVTLEDALENIDIGGPTMIRAAAKNFPDVIVLVDPADYDWVGERLAGGGGAASRSARARCNATTCADSASKAGDGSGGAAGTAGVCSTAAAGSTSATWIGAGSGDEV